MNYLSLASVSILIIVHILVGRMHFLGREASRTIGAGIAMSYVFLDVLPHLSSKQYTLQNTVGNVFGIYLANHAYLLALTGFVLYLCLSSVAKVYRTTQIVMTEQRSPHLVVYLLVQAIAAYCFLIGYLIGEQPDHRYEPVIIFAVAMAIHMATVGHTIHDLYPKVYDRIFRYVLAGATLAGWLLGSLTTVPDATFALVFSFVVGVIMIVAFIYELPVVMTSQRYWLFVVGVITFSAMLLVYETLSMVDLGS